MKPLPKSMCVFFFFSSAPLLPLVAADPLQCLEHDDRVSADDLCDSLDSNRTSNEPGGVLPTYHHAEFDLLSAVLLLDGLVQDDVQEDVIATQNANDLSAAV
jgi:hypothetical protein